MSKKKKQCTTMDHGYRIGEGKEDFFDKIDFEISLILLELSHPVVFSSDSPFLHNWGRTKKRSSSVSLHRPEVSPEPMFKSLPSTEVVEMGSTSSSSCLTGEAKKTNPQINKKSLEEEFSTIKQKSQPKISSQPSASCSVLEIQAETGLIRAQVGLVAQPIAEMRGRDDQTLRHFQPLISADRTVNMRGEVDTALLLRQARDNLERRSFDLNLLPASVDGNRIAAMVDFQRMATKVQAAAQARQRRLGLIRSKRLYNRFISPYHFK